MPLLTCIHRLESELLPACRLPMQNADDRFEIHLHVCILITRLYYMGRST